MFNHKGKVKFLIAGTQKGATTTLHKLLSEHKSLHMAQAKELHFFNTDRYFKWPVDLVYKRFYLAYERNFKPDISNQVLGESTPDYMYVEEAAKRVFQYNNRMKWIVIIRHPIYRAFSGWNMMRWRKSDSKVGKETLSFREALIAEPERIKCPEQRIAYGYLDRSYYSEQIRRIHRYFGRDNLYITTTQTLKTQPETVLSEICDFLEIDNEFLDVGSIVAHKGNYVGERLDDELKYQYIREMEYEIYESSRVANIDLSSWLDPGYIEEAASV